MAALPMIATFAGFVTPAGNLCRGELGVLMASLLSGIVAALMLSVIGRSNETSLSR
jgi:hypothetical protein